MIPQVVVIDRGDVTTFDSVADAESYIEPYDLEVLDIFDNTGHRLASRVVENRVTLLEAAAGSPLEADVLITAIRELQVRMGMNYRPEQSLQELLAIVHPFSRTK